MPVLKEQVLKEIQLLPETEPLWETISRLLESRKTKPNTFRGRPLVQIEDITDENWTLPREPEWDEKWEEANK